jgi:PAP2 superfamily
MFDSLFDFDCSASSRLEIDTSPPALRSIALDKDSDTGHLGDWRTETAVVDLVGRTEAFATVTIGDVTTAADRRGRFELEDVHLELGTDDYIITLTDRVGNTTTSTIEVTRLANSAVHWNEIALEAIKDTSTAPMYATRLLAMESVAVYDVLNAIEHDPLFVADLDRPVRGGKINTEAAIAQTAYEVLMGIYASDSGPYAGSAALRENLQAELTASLAEIPDGGAEQRGIRLGHDIAQSILAQRAGDGWNAVVDPQTEIGTDPGEWRPTPAGFANPLAPHWGDVTPWAVESAQQFIPEAPPTLTSNEYAAAYNETKQLGAANSEQLGLRTADQTQIALFWADGAGTHTPPGHWNKIAGEVAQVEGRTTAEIAGLFAELNVALADAAITCWEAKYTYDLWRPVTAINLGDLDGNPLTVADPSWRPLIVTPPFPEYTSGHSTFSGAAATILTAEFGDNYAFTTGTSSTDPAIADVTRSFSSFTEAAEEAGRSRIYGGIHFEFANQNGLESGRQIAEWVRVQFAGLRA